MAFSHETKPPAADIRFMKAALALAEKGRGRTSPNPMVGAVLVKDGRIIGKGFHEAYGRVHAEVNAIIDAGSGAHGADLYVTLEPCNHQGKTPPCTHKILAAGIRRVVAAMEDPNPDVSGGGLAYLAEHGVEILSGVCRREAEKLNEGWLKFITTGRPFVTLKCAATLDGRIATRTGDAKWISGDASRIFVHRLRDAADAILVGSGTVAADNPSLTARLPQGGGRDPARIVLDTHLSIDEQARVLRLESDSDTILATGFIDSRTAAFHKKKRLQQQGVQILETPLENGRISLPALVDRLGEMSMTSLLIEGGAKVIASALKARIVDKIFFFFAPKITGGDDGVPICSGSGAALIADCITVENVKVHRFENDVMIEGDLQRCRS